MKHQRKNRDSRRKRNSAAKREALIAAATKLFAERGFASTTTREIAMKAKCAEGLIHRYFGAKSGLLLAILNDLSSNQEELLLSGAHPGDSLGEELQRLVRAQLDHLWKKRDFIRISLSQALIDPKVAAAVDPIRHKSENRIAQQLGRHKGSKGIKAHDIEIMAQAVTALTFIFGFVGPAIMGHKRSRSWKQAFDIVDLMSRAVQTRRASALPR